MVQVQVDLTDEENKQVNIIKATKSLKSKSEAIKNILKNVEVEKDERKNTVETAMEQSETPKI